MAFNRFSSFSAPSRVLLPLLLICICASSTLSLHWPVTRWFPGSQPVSPLSRGRQQNPVTNNIIDNNLDVDSTTSDDVDAFVPFIARLVEATTVPASPTMTGTATATPSPSLTASLSLFASPSSTPSLSFSVTASISPSVSVTPSVSRTPGGSPAPSVTMSTSPTNTGTATATPSVSPSNGDFDGPSLPSLSASASPSGTKSAKPGKTCGVPANDNVSIACRQLISRRRLHKQSGGIRVRVWTVFGRFRWQVRAVRKDVRIKYIATLITTRRSPSTMTVNRRRVALGEDGVRVVSRLQGDLIEHMLHPQWNRVDNNGCCGARAAAWINIQLCRVGGEHDGKCYKRRHVVLRLVIRCKRVCVVHHATGTPIGMSKHQRCPRCAQ